MGFLSKLAQRTKALLGMTDAPKVAEAATRRALNPAEQRLVAQWQERVRRYQRNRALRMRPWLRNKYFRTPADGTPAWRRRQAKGVAA